MRSTRPPAPKSPQGRPVAASTQTSQPSPVPQNTRALASRAAPVGDSALVPHHAHRRGARLVALRVVDPEGAAGGAVDGGPLRDRRVEVERAADHERRGLEVLQHRWPAGPPAIRVLLLERGEHRVGRTDPVAAGFGLRQVRVGGLPAPRHRQSREVRGVDPIERRIVGRAGVAAVARPLAARGALLRGQA